MMVRRLVIFLLVVISALALTGCTRVELEEGDWGYVDVSEGDPASSNESVIRGDATEAQVSIRMGVGELRVDSGAGLKQLMEAEFDWSHDELRPHVTHDISGDTTELLIEQGSVDFNPWPRGDFRSVWDIALAEDLPMDLDIDMGAGEAELMLGGLTLSDLDVDLGAGAVTIDLSEFEDDLDADVNAGVGELTLRVPADVGVRVSGRSGGIGEYQADGFRSEGDAWVNDEWGESDTEIDIDLNRGVGMVRLELVD